MTSQRPFPRFDIRTVTRGDGGYAAFLIDHDTGDSWIFDRDLKWKKIIRSTTAARPKTQPKPRAAKKASKKAPTARRNKARG